MGLDLLPSPAPVYFSRGARTRAMSLQARYRSAAQFMSARFHVERPFVMAVLNVDHWTALDSSQYGVPFASNPPHVVALPAAPERAAVAARFAAVRPAAVASNLEALGRLGLTYDEATPRAVDLIGIHEWARVHLEPLGVRDVAPWLEHLLASYVAYAFLAERDPTAITIANVFAHTVVAGVTPATRRLEEFNPLLAPDTYDWFQAQFNLGAAAVLQSARGRDLFAALRAAGLAAGSRALATPELIDRLEMVIPGLRDWAETVASAR
jgi:hypothetical protein